MNNITEEIKLNNLEKERMEKDTQTYIKATERPSNMVRHWFKVAKTQADMYRRLANN